MPDYDKIAAKYGGTTSAGQAPDKYALLAQKYGGAAGDMAPPGPAPTRLEKIGHGIMDPINGGAQLLTHLLPDNLVQVGNRANNWLADKTGLVARLPEGGVDQMVRQGEQQYEARRAAAGQTGFDGYRAIGGLLGSAPLGLATGGMGAGAGLIGRAGIGAAQGAASSALSPTTGDGDYWTEKAKQVGTGAALGGVLAPVIGVAARLISPNASKNAKVALLRSEGVTPTIGQALGGMANKVEEKLVSTPLLGDAIRGARGRANSQFQAAAFNRALAPIGEALPQGVAGREAINYTEDLLRQRYDGVLNNIGAIPVDQTFGANLQNLGQMVNRAILSQDAKTKFGTVLGDVRSAFNNGVLTSEGYKTLESALGSDFRRLTSSQDIYDGRLAPAVKQLQQELRDLLQRQAGSHADELAAVNTGWANFKRVQRAASTLGAEDGNFTPAQYQNAVRALDKSKDKAAFARGSALNQDLSDAGKSVLTNTVPNSGTADRLMNAGVIGSWLVKPAIPASLLASSALYLSPVQRALVAAASSRPAAAQPAADALRQAAPMLIPGLSQLPLY